MVHWCFLSLIFSSACFLSHRKTAGARHSLFLFLFMDKNRNKLTWLNIRIYIYRTIANITCFFFLRRFFFFCDLFFSNWWPTARFCLTARILKHQMVQKNLRFNGFASPFANFNQVEKCEWRTDFFGDKELGWRFGMTYFLDVWMILCEIWKA